MESHQLCNRNHDEKFFLHLSLEKVTLFCISIFIMKLILNQKTQNNFCSSQIIVEGRCIHNKTHGKKIPGQKTPRIKNTKAKLDIKHYCKIGHKTLFKKTL